MPGTLRKLSVRVLLWACLATIVAGLALVLTACISELRRREAIVADAYATFGREALVSQAHYPLWARTWIGADREPNGWETVVEINLDGTAISDDDLPGLVANLQRFPDVRVLALGHTAVSDNGIQELKPLSHFELIILPRSGVTEAGVAELRRLLPGVTIKTE